MNHAQPTSRQLRELGTDLLATRARDDHYLASRWRLALTNAYQMSPTVRGELEHFGLAELPNVWASSRDVEQAMSDEALRLEAMALFADAHRAALAADDGPAL